MEDELTGQEVAVKRYLDAQAEVDGCLRTLYIPSKIKDCFAYITEQAKKQAVNGCAMIEDSVVFKWARDYYIEELPKKAGKKEVDALAEKSVSDIEKLDKNDPPKVSDEVKNMADKADKILDKPKVVTQLCFDFGA
ncbi:MAG: hypothetical protein IKP60_13785 [Treponema sp.]|nr:hypothetical protein [Treponema sp.]